MKGCRWGNRCRYNHSNPNSIPLCRPYTYNNCQYGSNCKFRHVQHETSSHCNNYYPRVNSNSIQLRPSTRRPRWKGHRKLSSQDITNNVVQIGNFIWYSTRYDKGEQGIVKYCPKTDKVKGVYRYPAFIRATHHSVCLYKDLIYIIDGHNSCEIIEFNPSTKIFTKKMKIDKIGLYPAAITVGECIHIYGDGLRYKSTAFLYSPLDNTIKRMKDEFAEKLGRSVGIVKYGEQLLRFGGYNCIKREQVDHFIIGENNNIDIVHGYIHQNTNTMIPSEIINVVYRLYCNGYDYNWTMMDDLKLQRKMDSFGLIMYKDFIITFGGECSDGVFPYHDDIFILDLRNRNKGWTKSDVECPAMREPRAVLTKDNTVHLFGCSYHYSMPLASLLPNL